ncbi:hypothetical protein AB3S75_017817 [Citrus x aurantiifolia]
MEAIPEDLLAEVLASQQASSIAQGLAHHGEGQPVDMDNASVIATFPADLCEEVLLTSSEAVLSVLPSSLLAEAHISRVQAKSHYWTCSLFGGSNEEGRRADSDGQGCWGYNR